MPRSASVRRRDALDIWNAGVEAVAPDRLVQANIRVEQGRLLVADAEPIALDAIDRLLVVGAGKAGEAMAAGLEMALESTWCDRLQLSGWVNVPQSPCITSTGAARPTASTRRIHLHPARPPGINEPTPQGAAGSREMLRLLAGLGPRDVCICLISGGGSALLPAPIDGISLEDKLAVTRRLSDAGANIEQLNTVRKQLSRVKGGGLARACRAGRLLSLIISDVLGDRLDIIASGPTVDDPSTPQEALDILCRFDLARAVPERVYEILRSRAAEGSPAPGKSSAVVTNHVIGNIATAVDAAGLAAERLGYSHAMVCATSSEGLAEDVGRHLARTAVQMCRGPGPDCLISGGEPVVKLASRDRRGLGGRNQQLALAALQSLAEASTKGVTILSAGTDGEDGPTDAAGAIVDEEIIRAAAERGLDPADFLARNDAYRFFDPLGALIKPGPTGTNVCDVRVIVVDRAELQS